MTWLVILGALLVLFLLVYLLAQIVTAYQQETVKELNNQQQELSASIEGENSSEGAAGEKEELRTARENVAQSIVPAAPLIHTVAESLPEDGYIQEFDYTYPSTLVVTTQLQEVNEAADLQHALGKERMFSEVSMQTLNYSDPLADRSETFQEDERMPRYEAVYEISLTAEAVRRAGVENEN